MRIRIRTTGGIALALIALPAACAADSAYPERPVRLIVPFAPGGANGAGGNVGTEIASRARPDGYTLLVGSASTLGANVALYRKLPFDVARDFDPVILLVSAPYILCVNANVPAKTLQELIQIAKSKRLSYSSWGEGGSGHLITEMLESMAGIDMLHVPYKGGAPALTAAIAGEVHPTISNASVALPRVRAGKLNALAVTSKRRSGIIPSLPTVAESGLPGFEAEAWVGIVAPAGLSGTLLRRIHRGLMAVVAAEPARSQMVARGMEIVGTQPEEFRQHLNAEVARWRRVVAAAGIAQR